MFALPLSPFNCNITTLLTTVHSVLTIEFKLADRLSLHYPSQTSVMPRLCKEDGVNCVNSVVVTKLRIIQLSFV